MIKFRIRCICFACMVLLALAGCLGRETKTPPIVAIAEPSAPIVGQVKCVEIRGDYAGMVETGIHVNAGDSYTLLAAGVVDIYPRHGIRKTPENGMFFVKFGRGAPFLALPTLSTGSTTEAVGSGELRIGFSDGGFKLDGTAMRPHYYKDNTGSFSVEIIVWKKRDFVQIADYLETLRRKDPGNKALQDALKEANTLKEYQVVSEQTSREIADTKNRIEDLRADRVEQREAVKPAPAKAPEEESGRLERISQLEERLSKLSEKLAHLEEMKSQFEEERKRSSALAQELEEKEKKEKDLISRLGDGVKGAPVIVIANPKEGSRVEVNVVHLSGAVETEQGLSGVEIFVNGKPLKKAGERGLVVRDAEPPRRLDFNEPIPLGPGPNEIRIRAADRGGRETEKVLLVHRAEMEKNVWAVVIGVNAYAKAPRLKYAVNDAKAFHRYLIEQTRLPEESITLLLDQEATLSRLRSALGTHLKNKAGKEDMVILFFAGHGATERDVMSPDGDGLEKYLLPCDADPKDLYASALPMREISHILQRIRSERMIFIVDACYSGASGGRTIASPGLRATISDAFLDRVASGRGTIILTASGANEVSVENDEFGHGVFTYYLLEGLQGEADVDRDGLISVDEAYGYVARLVPKATGQEQHPVKKGHVEGSLILGVTPGRQR